MVFVVFGVFFWNLNLFNLDASVCVFVVIVMLGEFVVFVELGVCFLSESLPLVPVLNFNPSVSDCAGMSLGGITGTLNMGGDGERMGDVGVENEIGDLKTWVVKMGVVGVEGRASQWCREVGGGGRRVDGVGCEVDGVGIEEVGTEGGEKTVTQASLQLIIALDLEL